MFYPIWLTSARAALELRPRLETPWSDGDLRRYFDDEFTPTEAASELAMRDTARR